MILGELGRSDAILEVPNFFTIDLYLNNVPEGTRKYLLVEKKTASAVIIK